MQSAKWIKIGMLLLAVGALPMVADGRERRFTLWPFGDDQEAAAAAPSKNAERERPWYLRSPIEMPELHAPRRPLLPGRDGEASHPIRERLAAPVTNGAHYMAEGTRKAWTATRDTFSWADTEESPRITRREPTPMWKRMFGQEEEKPQDPQTVVEWMAQDRLNP